jgi:transcriptional regulator with XRE-family HTH domain
MYIGNPGRGKAFLDARRRLRMSQGHLAGAAGISERTVRRAERGLPLTDEVSRALCSVLGMDLATLAAAPEVPSANAGSPVPGPREMVRSEFGVRMYTRSLTHWFGGLHPAILYPMVLLFLVGPPNRIALGILVGVPVALLMWMFQSARQEGCTRREAIEFMQGKRFCDGMPVDLDGRLIALAKTHGLEVPSRRIIGKPVPLPLHVQVPASDDVPNGPALSGW